MPKSIADASSRTIEIKVAISAVIHSEPEAGGFSAEVPALPGCYTQGETLQEVKANLQDAIEGWLAVAHDDATANLAAPRKRA
jgi:predicted RNase H-like HicB family nuclease